MELFSKFYSQINLWDKNKINYNFVFFFASPAHLSISSRIGNSKIAFGALNYQEEYRLIRETVKKAKIEITV
jgi:hypothetical protein